ncbi:hypothetical protein Tco_1429922 [Tanacetum coccineum]
MPSLNNVLENQIFKISSDDSYYSNLEVYNLEEQDDGDNLVVPQTPSGEIRNTIDNTRCPTPLFQEIGKSKENLIRLHKISQDFANQNPDLVTVIHFKKGIAKYAKVSSTAQKCLDLDSSYFIQEIILL